MIIRKTTPEDIPAVMQIYDEARAFMRENGNPTQWKDGTPPQKLIERDVREQKSYVCVENNKIIAVFYFNVEHEPAYDSIDGAWLNNNNSGVIHRIAKRRSAPKGVGAFCISWCFGQCGDIKIDTHENNAPMLKLLANLGFARCGIVTYPDGGIRTAFQKIKEKL
jgi:RimJ/RimL family protein N-acetyltransferase